jgi:hypothetical protein
MCTTRQHDVALARRSYRALTPRMQHMLCGVLVECGARLTIRDAPHPPTDGRTWIWSSSGHRPSIRESAHVANHFFRSPTNPTRSCSCFPSTTRTHVHAHIPGSQQPVAIHTTPILVSNEPPQLSSPTLMSTSRRTVRGESTHTSTPCRSSRGLQATRARWVNCLMHFS